MKYVRLPHSDCAAPSARHSTQQLHFELHRIPLGQKVDLTSRVAGKAAVVLAQLSEQERCAIGPTEYLYAPVSCMAASGHCLCS